LEETFHLVTFKFHESSFDSMGESGFREQIEYAGAVLANSCAQEEVAHYVAPGIPTSFS
jgi:hypothetical protein